ncbi:MAG: hypothetical protein [Arizlama microvirus]|nr:MAG: hypothetical protein [Arizlama microvirus]
MLKLNMKTQKQNEVNGKAEITFSIEETMKFIQQDLEAAHYLLGFVLQTPNIREAVIEHMASQIMDYTVKTTGSSIDQQTKENA